MINEDESELAFLAGKFFDYEIPKDKQFLYKYFKTTIGKALVKYICCIGNFKYFTDHTGLYCAAKWLNRIKRRYEVLIELHAKAKKEIDLDMLTKIESGKLQKIDKLVSQFPREKRFIALSKEAKLWKQARLYGKDL